MTNLEVQALTSVIQQAHRRVYSAASAGQRDGAYQRNLRLLSEAVARGAELMSVARREVSGSPARIGERPPREVALATWREFVRQFVAARTTWFNETRSGVPVSGTQSSLGDTAMNQAWVTGKTTELSNAAARVRNRARGTAEYTQALRALANLVASVGNEIMRYQGSRTQEQMLASPPPGVGLAVWHRLFDMRARANVTLRGESTGAARTTPSSTSTLEFSHIPPAIPQKQEPAAESPARQTRRASTPRAAAASGGAQAHDVEFDLPSPREAIATITEVGGEALDTARGTFSALRTVGTLLTGAPSDLLGGGITTPLRVIDRLQAIATVLNPPSVAIYQRPWFWPTILGVGGYLGYSYYKSTQAKKPAASPAAKKKAIETAPTLPAVR